MSDSVIGYMITYKQFLADVESLFQAGSINGTELIITF